jgi:hypothetical protein
VLTDDVVTPCCLLLLLLLAGALVMPLMAQGFRMGLIKFVLITGQKPQQQKQQ